MMTKNMYYYCQISIIVTVVFTICRAHDADDVKIMLKRYGTNMCIKMDAVSATQTPRVHAVSLKSCEFQSTSNGMTFSILPLEPSEPVENEEDIPKIMDEHLIRISGSTCLISGTENYSLKTGKCNVRHARYVIDHILPEKLHRKAPAGHNPSASINSEAINRNEPRNPENTTKNVYAFLFRQNEYCLTDQTTTNKALSSVVMSPCVQDDVSQMWSICSTSGECSEIILRFFNLPLYPTAPEVRTDRPVQSTSQQPSVTQKVTTEKFVPETTAKSTTEANPEPTQTTKPADMQTVSPLPCESSLHLLKSENYTCTTNSSSLKKLSSSSAIVLLFCIWTLI